MMTIQKFKTRWESDGFGGGITYEDIAKCAKAWGLFQRPMKCDIRLVTYRVLKHADCKDAEYYKPSVDDD